MYNVDFNMHYNIIPYVQAKMLISQYLNASGGKFFLMINFNF